MGAVKRDPYNQQLMISTNYADLNSVKRCIRNLDLLYKLCMKGDQVAISIHIDLLGMLGYYKNVISPLSDKQLLSIRLNLIEGYSQQEVAVMIDIGQTTVSHLIKSGIKKISNELREK